MAEAYGVDEINQDIAELLAEIKRLEIILNRKHDDIYFSTPNWNKFMMKVRELRVQQLVRFSPDLRAVLDDLIYARRGVKLGKSAEVARYMLRDFFKYLAPFLIGLSGFSLALLAWIFPIAKLLLIIAAILAVIALVVAGVVYLVKLKAKPVSPSPTRPLPREDKKPDKPPEKVYPPPIIPIIPGSQRGPALCCCAEDIVLFWKQLPESDRRVGHELNTLITLQYQESSQPGDCELQWWECFDDSRSDPKHRIVKLTEKQLTNVWEERYQKWVAHGRNRLQGSDFFWWDNHERRLGRVSAKEALEDADVPSEPKSRDVERILKFEIRVISAKKVCKCKYAAVVYKATQHVKIVNGKAEGKPIFTPLGKEFRVVAPRGKPKW